MFSLLSTILSAFISFIILLPSVVTEVVVVEEVGAVVASKIPRLFSIYDAPLIYACCSNRDISIHQDDHK